MTKVEEVFEALQKKHGSSYKPEQLWAWANTYDSDAKAYTTVEEPSGRYFKKTTTEIELSTTSACHNTTK